MTPTTANIKITNCTPHACNIVRKDGSVLDIPASGIIPRLSQTQSVVEVIDGIEITRQSFGAVENLPAPQEGVRLIVSRMVAQAFPERRDLLVPGPLVRGDNGQPVGCQGLSVI